MIKKSKKLKYLLLSLSLIGSDAYTLPYAPTSFTYDQIYQDKNGIIFNSANLPIIVGGGILGATIIGIGVGYVAHRLRSNSRNERSVNGANALNNTEQAAQPTTAVAQNAASLELNTELHTQSAPELNTQADASSGEQTLNSEAPSTSGYNPLDVSPAKTIPAIQQIAFTLDIYSNNILKLNVYEKNFKPYITDEVKLTFNEIKYIADKLMSHFNNPEKEKMDTYVRSRIHPFIRQRIQQNQKEDSSAIFFTRHDILLYKLRDMYYHLENKWWQTK